MGNLPLRIRTPGKLMIAGEFAVLEPGYKLIAMAVNKYVYATLEEADTCTLSLDNFGLHNVPWHYKNGHIEIETDDSRVDHTTNALEIACRYLDEQGITHRSFHLQLRSELDDPSGKKYGLGSSAAIVTSVMSAMLTAHLPEAPDAKLVFKLAAFAHVSTQGNGSGADVAASAYGGFIEYTSFQADWLLRAGAEATSLTELINKQWTYLSIRPFQLPNTVHMAIGWTGKPALTGKLVDGILTLRTQSPEVYQRFLDESQLAVDQFIQGAKTDNIPLMLSGVTLNRRTLTELGNSAGVTIETHQLRLLSDIAEKYGGVGKSSGAGGGDCGLAFMDAKAAVARVHEAWTAVGIEVLPLKPASTGATIVT